MLAKPWMQTWVTSQRDLSKAKHIGPSSSEQLHRSSETLKLALTSPPPPAPPPPLILPVRSAHLSHQPFCGADNAYVIGGRLFLDPDDIVLAEALELTQQKQQQPWMVLGVLSGKLPRLHICDQTTVFGRHPDCAIRFDDVHISLQHCTIDRGRGSVSALLTNLSSNGTYVNSQRIEGTTMLNKGDDLVLLFDRIDGALYEKTLLGQQKAIDRNGYPVLVGFRVISM
ncbi:hypothetical protein H4S07_002042 [Coemansia furcata]|uniref:Uncharacterized protein n=1 Tax=Coemansia furcata TaxID=417177 RepID=A0ACC1LLM6_9FUNG|nr:hypothetical protein H4S07_002042 [Coemansia furcata]